MGTIHEIDVQPFPVEMKTDASVNVTISATLTLNTAIPAGAKVALNITREGITDIPFPCQDWLGWVGSW